MSAFISSHARILTRNFPWESRHPAPIAPAAADTGHIQSELTVSPPNKLRALTPPSQDPIAPYFSYDPISHIILPTPPQKTASPSLVSPHFTPSCPAPHSTASTMADVGAEAAKRLRTEYKDLSKQTWTNIELVDDNIFEWRVALIVLNPDSLYYGGYFNAIMSFPRRYPYAPPDFRFARPLYHPNVYDNGRLCISILHPPGDDEMSGESAAERWSPVQSAESVLLSILSLLDDAECSSPANVDAGILLRKDPVEYKQRVKRDTERSKQDIPAGFKMPTHEDAFKSLKKPEDDYLMSWDDSDEGEVDFGSESDMEDMDAEFGDEDANLSDNDE